MSEDMNEHTPLPCPFCGNHLKHSPGHKVLLTGHADDCFLKGKPTFSDDLEAWNRRSPTLLTRVRELEAERDAANARADRARDLLQDCYRLLDQTYRETSSWPDNPPGPADEWSYNLIPIFSAIQNETGKDHGELTALKTQEASHG
jgi:hypothetical protein